MRNYSDEDDDYNYSPNDLAELSIRHKEKYEQIVNSNLEEGDSISKWEQRNLENTKDFLAHQRFRKNNE